MRHLQKSGIVTLQAIGGPIGSKTAPVQEAYEVHYSDGIRAAKKFSNERQAIEFAKDLIKSKKGLQFVDVFNAGSGFHSTADTDAIVAWWGDGSYTSNKSKHDSKLASKKIKESVVTEGFSDNKNLNYIMKGKKIKNVVYDDNIGFAIILDNGKYIRFDTHSAKPGMVKDLKMESVNEGTNEEWAGLDTIKRGGYGSSRLQNGDKIRMVIDARKNKYYNGVINGSSIKWEDGAKSELSLSTQASNRGDLQVLRPTTKNESVNEGKKSFKINPPIGKAKYSISSHNGSSTHNDGSDFWDIKIFKNKIDLEKGIKDFKSKGFVEENIENVANGLPQTMGKQKSLKREALKSIVREVMQEEAEYQKFFQKVLDKAGKSIPSMSDDEKKAFFNKVDAAWKGKQEGK
jgi:hypothetical protein